METLIGIKVGKNFKVSGAALRIETQKEQGAFVLLYNNTTGRLSNPDSSFRFAMNHMDLVKQINQVAGTFFDNITFEL